MMNNESLVIQGLCRFISENNESLLSLHMITWGHLVHLSIAMITLLILLACYDYQILGGFLLIEHSYDYPTDPAYTPGLKIIWGLPV